MYYILNVCSAMWTLVLYNMKYSCVPFSWRFHIISWVEILAKVIIKNKIWCVYICYLTTYPKMTSFSTQRIFLVVQLQWNVPNNKFTCSVKDRISFIYTWIVISFILIYDKLMFYNVTILLYHCSYQWSKTGVLYRYIICF